MHAALAAFIDRLGTVAQYGFDTYGTLPGSFITIVPPGFVQAVHLDTELYDEHCRKGAYVQTHAEHIRRWYG